MEEDKKNEEIYKLYGKFLISFEHVSHVMRTTILFLVFPNHSEKQNTQNEILLEGLTADQIRNKFIALISEDFESTSSVFTLSKTISNIYERLTPIRNSFAHGTSFIGSSNIIKEAEDGLLLLRHPKLKKGGLDLNFKRYEVDALESSINLLEKLKYSVAIIAVAIMNKFEGKVYATGFNIDAFHVMQIEELLSLEKKLQKLITK